jgi:hypothetical protein
MTYKTTVHRADGTYVNMSFSLLRDAKGYARQTGRKGDRVVIEEHWEDEQNTLYKYTVDDWDEDT